ncbi:MAG: hypothetical protein H0U86_09730 [Chloroflexi bacterium]|nr:hypothetical protein [Chloroflexota bacterium]
MALRSAGIGALIVSLVAGMTSNLLFLAAFQFRTDWFLEPTRILAAGPTSAKLLRWASVLDLVGYYLATAVLAYVLWRQLRPRNPLVADLSVIAAFGYALAGGAGAAVLALVGPMLMLDHAGAAASDRAVIESQFAILFEVVWRSIWQLLDAILVGAWWLGIGLLVRADQPGLSRLSLVLGTTAAIGAVPTIAGLDLVRDVVLGIVFTLWTGWWIWLLVLFRRHGGPVVGPTAGV